MSLLSGFSILLHLSVIEPLIINLEPILTDLEKIFADTKFKTSIAANPALVADVAKISQLWRSVEGDVTAVKKDKNFMSKWHALDSASKDGNTLAQALSRVLESAEVHAYLGAATGDVRTLLFDLQNRLGAITGDLESIGVKLPSFPAVSTAPLAPAPLRTTAVGAPAPHTVNAHGVFAPAPAAAPPIQPGNPVQPVAPVDTAPIPSAPAVAEPGVFAAAPVAPAPIQPANPVQPVASAHAAFDKAAPADPK